MQSIHDVIVGLLRSSGPGFPVPHGGGPEYGGVSLFAHQIQQPHAVFAVRETEELRHRLAGCFLHQRSEIVDFLHGRLFRNLRHILVGHGMVADGMAFLHYFFGIIGIRFHIVANQKEGHLYVVVLQDLQQLVRLAHGAAGVEGQVYLLAASHPNRFFVGRQVLDLSREAGHLMVLLLHVIPGISLGIAACLGRRSGNGRFGRGGRGR
ncbi:hypothetical protein D3C76_1303160 [compost metagenome]